MPLFLGIDPGSRVTGFGIISQEGNVFKRVHSGVIRTHAEAMADKLLEIYQGISNVVHAYGPLEAAIEKVFVNLNPSSALTLGQARGTAMVAVANYAVPVFEYSARQIKQAVVGYGAAEKSQVEHMVKLQLSYRDKLLQDEADALACAICHAHTRNSIVRINSQTLGDKKTYKKGRIK